MHSTTLAIAGYTLLLSSVVALLMVIRRGCKWRMKSQFYILSTSDILNSAFTAIILLVNHLQMITSNYYTDENNNKKTYSKLKFYTTEEFDYEKVIDQQFERFNNSEKIDYFIDTYCNTTSVLIHYAMLLLPMTNNFISLLLFALRCNSNMKYISKKCSRLFKIERNCMESQTKLPDNTNEEKVENIEEDNLDHERCSSSDTTNTYINNFKNDLPLKTLENMKKVDDKTGVIYVLSQWLVPVIVTSILSLGEYQSMQSILERKTECAFSSSFPLYNCDMCNETSKFLQDLDTMQQNAVDNNYMPSENFNATSSSNTTQINEIVAKVYTIIQSVLNITYEKLNTSNPTETSDFLPTTNYSDTSNIVEPIMHNSELEDTLETIFSNQSGYVTNPVDQDPDKTTQYLNVQSWHVNFAENSAKYNTTKMKNITKEIFPFNYEETNMLNPLNITNEMYIKNQTQDSYTNSNKTTTKFSMISKEQIYADIIKRIQGFNKHSINNHRHRVNKYYGRKNPKQNEFKANVNDKFLMITKMNERQINKQNLKLPLCMSNKNFISTSFLKLYLFMLTILMYLFPILLSIILQTQNTILYKSILNKIDVNIALICASDQLQIKNKVNENSFNKRINMLAQNKLDSNLTSRQAHYSRDCQDSMQEDIENCFEISSEKKEPIGLDEKLVYDNRKTLYKDMLQETNDIQKILKMTKISLLLSILLWSPMFLEVLLKVYWCFGIPIWVIDTSFLGAILFGILRNIISLNIINIQDNNKVMNKKESTVYPTL